MPKIDSISTTRLALLLAGLVSFVIAACSNDVSTTVTDTTQISSLAECATYSGDIVIANATGTIDLTGMETIVGVITYGNDLPVDNVKIRSSTLKNITDGLSVYGAASDVSQSLGDLNISLPALESTYSLGVYWGWGRVSVNTDPKLNVTGFLAISGDDIEVTNLYLNVSTAANIDVGGISSSSSYEVLVSSSVVRVERDLSMAITEGVDKLLLEELEFVNYAAHISANKDLNYVSTSLVDAGLLRIQRNGKYISVSLPKLERLGGRSDPTDQTSTGDAGGIFREVLNISMPLLREAHGDDWFKGKLNFTSNFFSELYLPRLENANCTLGIDDNVALNDIWIPRLNYVKDLEVHSNPRLLNFTANLLKTADKVNMTGPFTNVEFFSLEVVTGDFYLVGDETMDCSWFDEHFLNNIVKGTYKCVGNHTKPSVERKPSTPTDEAQLEAWESGNGGDSEESDDEPKKESTGGGKSSGGLSTGAKAGIGAGVAVAVLVALGLGAWLFIHKRRKQRDTTTKATHDANNRFDKAELHGESGTPRAVPIQDDGKDMLVKDTAHVKELADTARLELPAESRAKPAELAA
ncbi:hypothetical protein G7Z17_g11945 [Cylindrodendrum hubeiense]|uniref:Sporulation-specific protein Sps2p n=1 Tax=Cylindrodendrum hubeiense TaxID=595255 RepID=A0A9P5L3I2_9HYPO|nr:hypothetical protein G7Z17_g11945 [Cylindrodendrum hubeiense]